MEEEEEKKDIKKEIVKIILSSLLLIWAIIIEKNTNLANWQYLIIFLIPYLIVGGEVLKEAVEKLFHGEFFEEAFLTYFLF